MSVDDRYDVAGLPEAQFEPGSDGMVLKNLLGITSKQTMDEAEARALEQAMDILSMTFVHSPSDSPWPQIFLISISAKHSHFHEKFARA